MMKARKTTTHSKRSLGFLRASLMGGALATGHWASAQTIGYDLTTRGTVLSANGALVFTDNGATVTSTSAGSGQFNRFWQASTSATSYWGVSTGGSVNSDMLNAGTHDKQFQDFTTYNINSVDYIGIALDINEALSTNSEYLSLDSVVLYKSTTASANGSTLSNFLATTPLSTVWSLDSLSTTSPTTGVTQDRTLLLDASLTTGSGGFADIYLMVPKSDFTTAGVSATDYIYLYASFGEIGTVNGRNYQNSGGFEEFGAISGVTFGSLPSTIVSATTIPETSPSAVFGIGLAAVGWWKARRRRSVSQLTA